MSRSRFQGDLRLSVKHDSIFDRLDWALVLSMLASTAVALLVPLPPSLIAPGFSSVILVEDWRALLLFSLSLGTMGILWYRRGDNPNVGILLPLMFSVLTISLWEFKAPGGGLLGGDSIGAGAQTASAIQTGHLALSGYGAYPGLYVVGAFLSASGMSIVSISLVMDILRAMIIGSFFYLVIDFFLRSSRTSSLLAVLSVVATEEIFKDPPFTPSAFGFSLFLVTALILVKMLSARTVSSRRLLLLAIVATSSIITYSATPFVITLVLGMALLLGPRREALVRTTGFLFAAWTIWTLYVALFVGVGARFLLNLENLFLGGSSPTSSAIGGHPFGFSILGLLSSNLAALPYEIGYLLPFWTLGFFGIGFVLWFIRAVRRKEVLLTSFVLAFLITGAFILTSTFPQGTGWPRVLPYLAPFFGATFGLTLGLRRRVILTSLLVLTLILTLPSVIAYSPEIGYNYAHYPSDYAMGAFLGNSLQSGSIFNGVGIASLNQGLISKVIGLVPSNVGITPDEEYRLLERGIQQFMASKGGSVMTSSMQFLQAYRHLFGYQASVNATRLLDSVIQNNSVVYTNGLGVTILPR